MSEQKENKSECDPEICLEDDRGKNYLRPSTIVAYTITSKTESHALRIMFSDGVSYMELKTQDRNRAEALEKKLGEYMCSVSMTGECPSFVCVGNDERKGFINRKFVISYSINRNGRAADTGAQEYALSIQLCNATTRLMNGHGLYMTTQDTQLVAEWENKLDGKTYSEIKVEEGEVIGYEPVIYFEATDGDRYEGHYMRRGNIRMCELFRDGSIYRIRIYLITGEMIDIITKQVGVANEWIKHLWGDSFF